jgi:hypothetical protein
MTPVRRSNAKIAFRGMNLGEVASDDHLVSRNGDRVDLSAANVRRPVCRIRGNDDLMTRRSGGDHGRCQDQRERHDQPQPSTGAT